MPCKSGIDVGGTFTDFVVMDERGYGRIIKVLSTPTSPADAVILGLGRAASAFGVRLGKVVLLSGWEARPGKGATAG